MNEHMTVSEAAKQLNVSASTLRRWDRDGTLVAERTLGGHRRYRRAHLLGLRSRAQREAAVAGVGELLSSLPADAPITGIQHSRRIPTGIGALDRALKGGYLGGWLWGVRGDDGSGKTAFALQAAATLARSGGYAVVVALDTLEDAVAARLEMLLAADQDALTRIAVLALDPRDVVTPELIGELVAETAASCFHGHTPGLVVIDPLYLVVPSGSSPVRPSFHDRSEALREGALAAGLVSYEFFQLAKRSGSAYLLVNQLVRRPSGKRDASGDRALDYYDLLCILGDDDNPEQRRYQSLVQLHLLKNRYGPELRCELTFGANGGLLGPDEHEAATDTSTAPLVLDPDTPADGPSLW
jgi:excisionase family DNA binding protein